MNRKQRRAVRAPKIADLSAPTRETLCCLLACMYDASPKTDGLSQDDFVAAVLELMDAGLAVIKDNGREYRLALAPGVVLVPRPALH